MRGAKQQDSPDAVSVGQRIKRIKFPWPQICSAMTELIRIDGVGR
jgi:hypothetical protein